MFHLSFQVGIRAVFPLLARSKIVKSIRLLIRVYEQNEHHIENRLCFIRFARILKISSQLLIINYIGGVLLCVCNPAILYYLNGTREVITAVLLPGTAIETNLQYGLNLAYQFYIIVSAGFIFTYFDLLFIVQLLHVMLMTNILRHKIVAISKMAATNESQMDVSLNLRNIINLHIELRR